MSCNCKAKEKMNKLQKLEPETVDVSSIEETGVMFYIVLIFRYFILTLKQISFFCILAFLFPFVVVHIIISAIFTQKVVLKIPFLNKI